MFMCLRNFSSKRCLFWTTTGLKLPIHTCSGGRLIRCGKPPITTDHNDTFITAARAMHEYFLQLEDLQGLPKKTILDGIEDNPVSETVCYLKSDVERIALDIWGSKEALVEKQEERKLLAEEAKKSRLDLGLHLKWVNKVQSRIEAEMKAFGNREQRVSFLRGSARVVTFAIVSNSLVFSFKLCAYFYTGSAAMLSEAVHSLADVLNQCLLALGISQSIRKPSPDHPYGFSRARYVYSLISGVGIFFLGAGVTVYHGVTGLIHPPVLHFLPAAFAVLAGSLMVEGVSALYMTCLYIATLMTAIRQVSSSAQESGVSFKEYVLRGRDPSAVAVLLEDSAAVTGILMAGTALWLSHITGSSIYDACGSIAIGGLLGTVALFLIQRNSSALVGRSIPPSELKEITNILENDAVVRSLHDVKAIDLGADLVRFKAEVHFDGMEIAKLNMKTMDLHKTLEKFQQCTTVEEVEGLLIEHGEQIIDLLGSEVDRIENLIKKQAPEVQHVDLEIL
ncbi:proton-coupled zinc antiporter SLC30A9, mitochondrial-like isoform X2 [Dysidea avara]|uniref:proton-coupled zinc antiporter SLC30A9, mitochondrial-like isoform X2 n=1 Tax=Dysidea avara TaxID=196820 RepID=UPI003330EF89